MTDTETQALNAALAKAQGSFPAITQNKRVETPKFSYSYAPLEDILAAVRPALAENGLAISQQLDHDGQGGRILRTELRHEGGGELVGEWPLNGTTDSMQAFGSELTYLRRYAITALLGIATEEDDDGQAVKPRTQRTQEQRSHEEQNLLAEIKQQYERLRQLEDELDVRPRTDWIAWSRVQLKVGPDVWLDAGQMRALIEMLERAKATLTREIAEQAVTEYRERETWEEDE